MNERGLKFSAPTAKSTTAHPPLPNEVLPPLVVQRLGGWLILRDDLLPGGTKRRVIHTLLTHGDEFIYASPPEGHAQVALAYACKDAGKLCTIFTAGRTPQHPNTLEAHNLGANVVSVRPGYLSNVQAKARKYFEHTPSARVLIPFGLDCQAIIHAIADVGRALSLDPPEVWCAAGSGVLTRGLQLAWPNAEHHVVAVGKPPNAGCGILHTAPEVFSASARFPPPFPSCPIYDAKCWQFFSRLARPGALLWNVA